MQLINGNATSQVIKDEVKAEVAAFVAAGKRQPHLVAILVGEDGASQTYVSHKMKACDYVGFRSTNLVFPSSISEAELLAEVEKCNNDDTIDGLIVQLPLPEHIEYMKVILAIRPDKDVDGFHPSNVGKMVMGLPTLLPATPYGVMELIQRHNIPTKGKNCVVIGRSLIVGTPMSILLSRIGIDGTSILTHRHTPPEKLKEFTKMADILIVAVGIPGFIKAEDVKEGVVIIDVGTTRVPDASKKSGYALKGDVDFENVSPKCSAITPVPGGVGPMTVTMLIKNTLEAYKRRISF
ncbi:MAG: bifunctional 5,10-methylenetetrahydrofolate dehydrogenase/5,10-methenyltetrahydrofolate cyclohydrolase [Bacteroidia bacterium]